MAALLPPTFRRCDGVGVRRARAPGEHFQLFAGPSSAAQHRHGCTTCVLGARECNALLHLSDSLFDSAALAWTSRAFVTTQMHPWDLSFYSRERGYPHLS